MTPSTTTGATVHGVKRPKLIHDYSDQQPLIPGLPDDIAQLCLSLIPPSTLYSVCRSWRRIIYSPSFPPFLSLYALLSPTPSTNQTHNSISENPIEFHSFDPISSKWDPLPPPSEQPLSLLVRHPSFISRRIPIQSVAVSGNLVLLSATTHHFLPALSHPLIFNPLSGKWAPGPPLSAPRRWCAAGAHGGAVYVASGIGSVYNTDVAKSVERWVVPRNQFQFQFRGRSEMICEWEKMGGLRDGKFSRDAIDGVGWRDKLCMVNVKGNAAKEGVMYDVVTGSPEEMPEGMLFGWRGPAAAMDEETIYCVDEAKGALRNYDSGEDRWVEVVESEKLRGAEQITAGGGRVCVVCGGVGGGEIVVVDVTMVPPSLCVVDLPVGFEAVSLHILPRMSHHPESKSFGIF